MIANPLVELREAKQSPWLDFISRELILSGQLERLIAEDGISGVTSNPTILEQAITSSELYDKAIFSLGEQGKTAVEIVEQLAAKDIRDAADLLREVFEQSKGRDGYVSLEVRPEYAYDTKATVENACYLFNQVGRGNTLIKVPATERGCEAIRELIIRGVNINATLIFSLSQYKRVTQAYIEGLKEREARRLPVNKVASVASVFVSRIDTAVDRIIDRVAQKSPEVRALRGAAALAYCKFIYLAFSGLFTSPEFKRLTRRGAKIQRLLWGSTSTKDPSYSDIKYVLGLIGMDTINTMPLRTLHAFRDHGKVFPSVEQNVEEAKRALDRLNQMGINLEAIGEELQREGIELFAQSWGKLVSAVEMKLQRLVSECK